MPALFETLTADEPRPRYRYPRDPSAHWIDRKAIGERLRIEEQLHREIAKLGEDVEGTPEAVTLSQLKMQAMQNNPALQPAARVRSQSETVATRLDNIKTLLSELSDLQDEVFAAPERVSLRSLLETLRHVEAELEAAVGRLSGDLGLVATMDHHTAS
jgi:hypothetical protein